MPLSRTIDPRDRFLRTTLTAPVSLLDVERHLNVVFGVGVEACPELIDARQVDSGEISVRAVMITLRHFGLGREEFAPRALVVSSQSVPFSTNPVGTTHPTIDMVASPNPSPSKSL